jgi:hypothetical protein
LQESREKIMEKWEKRFKTIPMKWPLDRSHIGRYQTQFERLNQPSKWITLQPLKEIKEYYSTSTTQ